MRARRLARMARRFMELPEVVHSPGQTSSRQMYPVHFIDLRPYAR
jgi:hypothetical protein